MVQSTRRSQPVRAERILVIRLGALGDVLRTLPALEALRAAYPGSHLCWLVEPAAAAIVSATGRVDETLVFPRETLSGALRRGQVAAFASELRSFLARLRARRFDLALDFHGIAKSGLLAWLSGAPIRFGYVWGVAREGASLFANRRVAPSPARVSRLERNAALVRAVARVARVPEGPLLSPSPAATLRLRERLADAGRAEASGFVLIHPGSSANARHKRYSAEGWSAAARRLVGSGREVWIVAGGSSDERALVDEILAHGDPRVVRAPETEGFDDLVALIARAAVFAAGDSGPLHAASLAGVPVVQLLGPTDPVHNAPAPASAWRRVHVPLPCSPCRRGCADAACMRAIAPERVAEAIESLLVLAGTRPEKAAPGGARAASAEPPGGGPNG